MKKNEGPSKILRIISLLVLFNVMIFSGYAFHNYNTYKNMKVVVSENTSIEYGSANYDIKSIIEKIDGKIVSVDNKVDTSVVGEQEIVVKVKKENVVKEFPIKVQVVDTVAPVIQLKEEKVTITEGDEYDLTNNVNSVSDSVDGIISYLNEADSDSNFYYNFDYDSEAINSVGTHEVTVNAKDKYGNLSTVTFTLEVIEAPKKKNVNNGSNYNSNLVSGLPGNAAGGDLVSIAYSLVGSPYVSGANGPAAFDCSGFVQYVYSRVGINVSRSSYTQANDGVGVSYAEAKPGDILSWGHGGRVTHSALYVGNGMMIHATNPSQGVIASSVSGWENRSVDNLMAVRRIQ